MNLGEYDATGRARYQRLADVVAALLAEALGQQPGFRLQHIQRRAKESASLRRKLERAGQLDTHDIESAAKDLAGCRLVFYTNSDVARFQGAGIITESFVVDWSRTKIHHPSPDVAEAADLFISNNYVLRLKDSYIAQAAYADLRDMWCEVQVQTTLNHAWSEMAHDTIYKKPALTGFGGSLMQAIEDRMKKIMREHLLPAGYEFQKVVDDFERLAAGKRLLDEGALRQLEGCADNNSRHEHLQRFKEYVLPSYDDLGKVQAEIRAAVVSAVLQSYVTEPRPIDTPFGSLAGQTVETIVKVAADILDYLRYCDVEATFDAICKLFQNAPSDRVKKRLLSSAEALSEHQMEVWKSEGPIVQMRLVEHVQRVDLRAIEGVRPVVLQVLGEILKSEIGGTSAAYNVVTFHQGAVVPSDGLEYARASAIDILKASFQRADCDDVRFEVVRALSRAMQPPLRGMPAALAKLLLKSTITIVDFYIEVAPQQSYELLEHIEHSLLWQYRHKGRSGVREEEPEITALRNTLSQAIFRFRDLINADRAFVIFKTLVGFESAFAPEWEGDGLDVEARENYRKARITDLVAEVTADSADEWLSVLSRCARADIKDGATFISFDQYLEELGRSKPEVLMSYLERLDAHLSNFLPAMLRGLEIGEGPKALHKKLLEWIGQRRYVGQIVWYQRYARQVDPRVLQAALEAAIETSDETAVFRAVATAVARHGDVEGGLIDRVFLPALGYLYERGDARWVDWISVAASGRAIFRELEPHQMEFVLTTLVGRAQIAYREEEILQEIAKREPMRVVDFFGRRLQVEYRKAREDRYEAVPYEFHLLATSLTTIPDYLVAAARQWFGDDKELFEYRGGRLLVNTFPAFTPEYEHALRMFCVEGTRTDLQFLVSVLSNYNGQAFTHNLVQSMVEMLPAADPLLRTISGVLDSTGSVMGEFGVVEVYRRKRQEFEPWLADGREKVREFARQHIHGLDLQIAVEQRRSEEALEFRKRSYPPPEGAGA